MVSAFQTKKMFAFVLWKEMKVDLYGFPGWQALFWASLIPLIVRSLSSVTVVQLYVVNIWNFDNANWLQIILAVGTKLQAILTRMALGITERHAVVQGIPLVQGSDQYFWFGWPQLLLHLIHFALFQVLFDLLDRLHPW